MYNEKFVAVLRNAVNNQVLREVDGAVLVPLGTEYQIQLKNMNSRRAAVSIHIDDTDVLDGQRIIVEPNETTHLEGYLDRAGRVTHRFKFIEKTAKISEHRGDKIEDGLLRIEFQFEAEKPEIKYTTTYHRHETYGWGHWWYPPYNASTPVWRGGHPHSYSDGILHTSKASASNHFGAMRGCTPKSYRDICKGGDGGTTYSANLNMNDCDSIQPTSANCSMGGAMGGGGPSLDCDVDYESLPTPKQTQRRGPGGQSVGAAPSLKDGITVKGSASDQTFKYGTLGTLEQNKHVIVLMLKGFMPSSGELVKTAVEVKKKLTCESCGRQCKSSQKFCPECGTALY